MNKKFKSVLISIYTVLLIVVSTTMYAQNKLLYQLKPATKLAEVGVVFENELDQIDSLMKRAIDAAVFPGARVLAARDGKVFYNKAFGTLDGNEENPVNLKTVYDLASITKIASTTLALMRLYEQGKIDLNKTLGDYLPITKGSNKEYCLVKDLLMHQAGMKSWIPFYKFFKDSSAAFKDGIFNNYKTKTYAIEVAKDVFMNATYRDTIWKMILESPLENKGKMVYSDLDFYFLGAIVQVLSGKTLDHYVYDEFYEPMGLRKTGYKPLSFMDESYIAPTEQDTTFRKQLLKGFVHDPGAALFGGVAGHAGLFSNAAELAALMQMLLNGGSYKGRVYFKAGTIQLFTSYQSTMSRKGFGFDKPQANANDAGPCSNYCSAYTYGHQGFTGTCVWVDPSQQLVFVFLSNRVYPYENSAINKWNIRSLVQDYIYKSLDIPENKERKLIYDQQMNGK